MAGEGRRVPMAMNDPETVRREYETDAGPPPAKPPTITRQDLTPASWFSMQWRRPPLEESWKLAAVRVNWPNVCNASWAPR